LHSYPLGVLQIHGEILSNSQCAMLDLQGHDEECQRLPPRRARWNKSASLGVTPGTRAHHRTAWSAGKCLPMLLEF